MTELETKIWNIVHNWCDEQSSEIPDQNRRYLMDEIKELVLSHVSKLLPSSEAAYSEQLVCDSCGCHPNVIYTTSRGRFCEGCKPAS